MDTTNVLIIEPDLEQQERFAAYLSDETDLVTVGIGTDLVSSCQSNYPPKSVDVLLINIDNPEMTRMASWAPIHALLPGVWIVGLVNDVDDLILKVALNVGDETEMGVYPDLYKSQRGTNLQTRLEEYTPAGMEVEIIFEN